MTEETQAATDPGDHEEADRLAYFRAVREGFERAERAAGAIARSYNVGGHTICLRFAGPALLSQLTPALAHLETTAVERPACTICLWDSASTGVRMPLLVGSLIQLLRLRWFEHLEGRREIKCYSGARIRTTFHLGPDILSAFDTREELAMYWIEDARAIPYYERGYPLQTILNWWSERRARYFVHAAAVGTGAGGALLAGQSGSGKSTTSLACLLSDLRVAGDDYTLVSLDGSPMGYSLYNTAKLRTADDLARFPTLRGAVGNADRLDREKPMIALHEHYPNKVLRSFPIRAILLPRVHGGMDTEIRSASAVVALKALAPSTILQLPGTGQVAFHAMAQLARRIPCYTLALGSDLARIPTAIARVLDETP